METSHGAQVSTYYCMAYVDSGRTADGGDAGSTTMRAIRIRSRGDGYALLAVEKFGWLLGCQDTDVAVSGHVAQLGSKARQLGSTVMQQRELVQPGQQTRNRNLRVVSLKYDLADCLRWIQRSAADIKVVMRGWMVAAVKESLCCVDAVKNYKMETNMRNRAPHELDFSDFGSESCPCQIACISRQLQNCVTSFRV